MYLKTGDSYNIKYTRPFQRHNYLISIRKAHEIENLTQALKQIIQFLQISTSLWNVGNSFFTDQMLSDIVKFANVKGRERLQKYNRPDTRHLVKDTLEEIQAFIALLYATGIQKSGRTEGTGMICGVPTTSALIFLEQ